jgi:DNA-binding response OmpR family regulator
VTQTIFALEDDPDISRLVRYHLEKAGFHVRAFATSADVVRRAETDKPSLFLLDIMVPGGDGRDVCRQIRETHAVAMTPIIFLTAKNAEPDRVAGLELGADDYITKPFSPRELVARVKAVLRRFERPLPRGEAPVKAVFGDLVIDSAAMILSVRGAPIRSTATEFRLLDYMASNAGRVFSRDQLLDAVWRDTSYVTPRSVDVYIRRLREKIEKDPENPQYLKTVRGAGYRFEAPK